MRSLATATRTGRIDTRALKEAVRLEEVAANYGIELKRQGRALVGRCPLHADAGRPNFYFRSCRTVRTLRAGRSPGPTRRDPLTRAIADLE
jgi:hypothetical protein